MFIAVIHKQVDASCELWAWLKGNRNGLEQKDEEAYKLNNSAIFQIYLVRC